MIQSSYLLPSVELNELIASYGIAEELSNNKNYFKDTVKLVQQITDSKVCYISILDSEKQIVISARGMKEFPFLRKDSICQFTVANREITIVRNLKKDMSTCTLPISKGKFKYYAGFPLINSDGVAIGSLCIMDKNSKTLKPRKIKCLKLIAKGIVEKLDVRRNMIKLIKDINKSFTPAACVDINCLSGELAHLQSEILKTKATLEFQKKQLNVVNSNLSNFSHRIAHDIKSPLKTINSFVQLINPESNHEISEERKSDSFKFINTAVAELTRMTDNLLSIAELKSNVKPEKVSISDLIDNIEILLSDNLRLKKVQLIKPNVDIQVVGFRTLLMQLFQNIISNGIKYSDPNKESFVKVNYKLLESSVLVEISDNGIGISKEDLHAIFKPFERASYSGEIEGFGIGLDTCKTIVEEMGSELKVISEPGVGTTFSFEIKTG